MSGVLSLTTFLRFLFVYKSMSAGRRNDKIKWPREKWWAFGAENCVRCFWLLDCFYSFFFVSIHLNLWNNNRWIRARRDEAERNRMGSDQRGRRQKRWTVQGGRSNRGYVFYHFFHLFYSSLILILLLSDCLFSAAGAYTVAFLLVLIYSAHVSSPSSSFPR